MTKLMTLRERRETLRASGAAIVNAYKGENREPTAGELEQLSDLTTQLTATEAEIIEAEAVADAERAFVMSGREPTAEAVAMAISPTGGFIDVGEFCAAVFRASANGAVADPRLLPDVSAQGPTTFGNESSGADGGYMVPAEFSARMRAHMLEEQSFLDMADVDEIAGNAMTFPRDETTPWGSNGVRAFWEAEAAQAQQTKPILGIDTSRLKKLMALVPMTDELLADQGVMGGYVTRKAAESIRWKSNDAMMNGNGAGQPFGMIAAGNSALVVQPKEGSQGAATIQAENVIKMYARNLNPGRAVWMVNPDAWPQLPLMTIGNQPVFTLPVGGQGLTVTPSGFLLGRPVMMTDTCQTVGNQGDIAFVDWGAYHAIVKAGRAIQNDLSIHLWFDYGVTAFRATFRLDGMPWHKEPVTPPNSSVTRSSAVVLAVRS